MPLIVWLGSAAVAASLPLAWWSLSTGRSLNHRVTRNLGDYSPTMREAVLERSALDRFVLPLARSAGSRLAHRTPAGWMETRSLLIARAGWTGRVTAEQILGAKLLLPLILGAFLALRLLGQPSAQSLIMTLAVMGAAFVIPDLLLRAKADRRAEDITMLLPDVLDQLTISVEAGLGFEAALSRMCRDEDHALAEEFGRMLQDVRLGASRSVALEAMAERTQVDDFKAVVLHLRQAEQLGVPLARSLRTLSAEMREKRRFRAEENANKLPVKMIFPLGVCILPALFIVILGPAVIQFTEMF